MNTAPTSSRMVARRAIGRCLAIAGVIAAATCLTIMAWPLLMLAGGHVVGLVGFLFFATLCAGMYATRSKSRAVRAMGKAVCLVSPLVILAAATLMWWVIASIELTW